MSEELTFKNGLHISWIRGLDGGGSTQYIDFLNYFEKYPRHYTHCLEWCAGLGAIGYSILDAGICDKISFNDLYPPAERYIVKNAVENNIQDKVNFYLGDCVSVIPKDQKFDLVVANPPHCKLNPQEVPGESFEDELNRRLILDTDWNIHHNFFNNIVPYLLPGADIILSETVIAEEHLAYARANKLQFVRYAPAQDLAKSSNPGAILMHYKYEA